MNCQIYPFVTNSYFAVQIYHKKHRFVKKSILFSQESRNLATYPFFWIIFLNLSKNVWICQKLYKIFQNRTNLSFLWLFCKRFLSNYHSNMQILFFLKFVPECENLSKFSTAHEHSKILTPNHNNSKS